MGSIQGRNVAATACDLRHSPHENRDNRRPRRPMSVADPALIAEACAALGVNDLGAIGAPGGQKAVRHVERAGENSF